MKKKKEYWSGLTLCTPGDLPDTGIQPGSLASPALVGRFFTTVPLGKPNFLCIITNPTQIPYSCVYLTF